MCIRDRLDAVAALRRLELVEDSGYMEEDSLPLSGSVSLLRRDIRSFQLAKAAVCAGVDTLLRAAGRAASEVETVWLAGGFGCKLSPDSAGAVGLLPRQLKMCIRDSLNILGKEFHNINNVCNVSLALFWFTNEVPVHFITNQIIT